MSSWNISLVLQAELYLVGTSICETKYSRIFAVPRKGKKASSLTKKQLIWHFWKQKLCLEVIPLACLPFHFLTFKQMLFCNKSPLLTNRTSLHPKQMLIGKNRESFKSLRTSFTQEYEFLLSSPGYQIKIS